MSPLHYVGAIHELFVTRQMNKQTHSDSIFKYKELEIDLRKSLSYIYPTKGVLDIALSYVMERDIYHEDALHMASAKASECDMYVMADPYKDIDKKKWKGNFEMIDLQEKEDTDSGLDKINQL